MLNITAKVTNTREMNLAFAKLEKAVRNRVARAAVSVGTRDLAKVAKAEARRVSTRTRQLWRSIGQKVKTYKNNALTVGIVGARRGFNKAVRFFDASKLKKERMTRKSKKRPQLAVFGPHVVWVKPSRYLHLVEKGTVHSRAKPFMQPAFDKAVGPVQATIADELKTRLAIEATKVRVKK